MQAVNGAQPKTKKFLIVTRKTKHSAAGKGVHTKRVKMHGLLWVEIALALLPDPNLKRLPTILPESGEKISTCLIQCFDSIFFLP